MDQQSLLWSFSSLAAIDLQAPARAHSLIFFLSTAKVNGIKLLVKFSFFYDAPEKHDLRQNPNKINGNI